MTFFYNQWFYWGDKVKVIESYQKYQMWILAKTIAELVPQQGQGQTPAPDKVGRQYILTEEKYKPEPYI